MSFVLQHDVRVCLPFEYVQTFRMDHHSRASPETGEPPVVDGGLSEFGLNADQYSCDGLVFIAGIGISANGRSASGIAVQSPVQRGCAPCDSTNSESR